MHKPAKICLLGYKEQTGNYQAALRRHGCIAVLPLEAASVFDLSVAPLSVHRLAERCDLLLLPGGGDIDPSFFHQPNTASRDVDFMLDRIQLLFWEAFVRMRKPVLGICKGMQLINVFFGGSLQQDMPLSSLKMHAYTTCDQYHVIEPVCTAACQKIGRSLPRDSLLTRSLMVNSAHHQSVDKIGRELHVLQQAPDHVAETLCHESLPIIGVQWHPERLFAEGEDHLRPLLTELLIRPAPV